MAAAKRSSSTLHQLEKSVINMILLLLSVSDRSIIMIGPGGLLLVVPAPICCPSFILMDGVAKKYITKLGCEKYFWRVTTY
jgi:hypothetical protein